ncbi:hypothetical protein HDU93_009961, partial [Gonapodya sp. JEL0774]
PHFIYYIALLLDILGRFAFLLKLLPAYAAVAWDLDQTSAAALTALDNLSGLDPALKVAEVARRWV